MTERNYKQDLIELARNLADLRLLISVFILLSSFVAFSTNLEWDEGSFLQNAENFSGDSSNFEESRPVAISYMISFLWIFTGESALAARLMVIGFGAATIYLFHRIAGEFFEKPINVTAVLALSPLMVYWSAHVYTDVPALFLLLASFYAYIREKHLIAGVLVSLSATMRYIFLIFAFGMGVAYIIDRREELQSLVTGGLIGSAPILLYSKLFYGGFLARVEMYLTRVSRWSDSGMFASMLPGVKSGILTVSALIPAMYPGWKQTSTLVKSMILSYTAFIVFISGNSYNRYWLAVLPFILLIAYRGLELKHFYLASALMIITSGFAVTEGALDQQRCVEPYQEAFEYSQQLEGSFVSDSWAIGGYILDKPVSSPWTDLESLREGEGIRYAVMSTDEDFDVVKSFSNSCRTVNIYDLSR